MIMPVKKTPMWLIERVAQGELSPAETQEIRDQLAAQGRSLDDELAALLVSNREILARLPRETMGAAIHRRASAEHQRRFRLPVVVAPLVLAGSVALAMFITRGSDRSVVRERLGEADDDVILKGDVLHSPRLLVYRQKTGPVPGSPSSERLYDGAHVARGDLLQLAYDKTPEGLFAVLLSIDGAGKVTQHLPEEGARTATPLTSVLEIRLPSAYELDDAPNFERFLLITSTQSFAVTFALDAARALAGGPAGKTQPLALGPAYRQTSILLHKIGKGAP
jgi:hypothetical protein